MLTLATYIQFQLLTRHFAYVPGIGAWMLRDVEAEGIKAPRKEIFLNRFASHDDGMTATLMMEAEHLSFDEAQARIVYESGLWLNALQHEGHVTIPGLGQLIYDDDHALVFRASAIAEPAYFGLAELSLRPLDELEISESEESAASLAAGSDLSGEAGVLEPTGSAEPSLSLPALWLRHVAACLLIVFGLFTASRGSLSDAGTHRDYASMLNMDVLMGKEDPYSLVAETWEEYVVSNDIEGLNEEAGQIEETPEAIPTVSNPEQNTHSANATSTLMLPTPTDKLYYIVIASCTSADEAQRVVRRFTDQGYDTVDVLERDGRYRIYINYFQVKDEAEARLREVRQTTRFQDAWMLPVRIQSLSYIIKNLYNGNQLSMELPHLNPTAERDQG